VALANGLWEHTVDQKTIAWWEGALGATDITLDVQIDADSTTEFDLTPIGAIVPNMNIAWGTEIVRVVSVDASAGTCEVARGQYGTTALAQILVTVTGKSLGVAPPETDDAGDATAAYGDDFTNYAHYLEEVVFITDPAQKVRTETPENSVAYQIGAKFGKMGAQLSNALWYSETNSATATHRTMNGLRAQIATNISTGVGALVFADLDDGVKSCMDNGVIPDTIFVGGTIKKALAQWAGARLTSSTSPAQMGVAGGQVQWYQSASGPNLQIKVDTTLPATEMLICAEANLRAGFVDLLTNPYAAETPGAPQSTGLRVELMGRSGPQSKIQVLAYITCQLLYEAGCQLLQGVTSVDADGIA